LSLGTGTFGGERDYAGRPRNADADAVHAMSLANMDGEYCRIEVASDILAALPQDGSNAVTLVLSDPTDATEQEQHDQNDQQQPQDAAQPGTAITAMRVISAAAAKHQDQDDDK
jgi:hypothetical protein